MTEVSPGVSEQRMLELEVQLRSMSREDRLPADFAFRVAERVGLAEPAAPVGEQAALVAGVSVIAGSGVGAMAWILRALDVLELGGDLSGSLVTSSGSMAMPVLVGSLALAFYALLDRFLASRKDRIA